jgi:ribosome-associated GTPase EngA
MIKPIVAIVGRPNVGKSTLFNALAGQRLSIVQDTPGVTRDRIYADVTWLDNVFTLIDTGGVEPENSDQMYVYMREQTEMAIAAADIIIFLTDVRTGLTDTDDAVAKILRISKKPIVLTVNKVDSFAKFANDIYEFYALGLGDPLPVSASGMQGLGDLLDVVAEKLKGVSGQLSMISGQKKKKTWAKGQAATSSVSADSVGTTPPFGHPPTGGEYLHEASMPTRGDLATSDFDEYDYKVSDDADGADFDDDDEDDGSDIPRVAIIGKPNVGKSSIINKMIGENRLIVSPIAGTTRDAVDTTLVWQDREYCFIDTAGLRRKSKVTGESERYSIIRTVSAVERCDVAIVVIDATEGVTEQDAKIVGIAHDRGKGLIIAVNKWDAIEKDDKTVYVHEKRIREVLAFAPYAEILYVSAQTGQRLTKFYDAVDRVLAAQTLRIQTGTLNELLAQATARHSPPTDKGRSCRIFYITQVAVKPPTFVLFVNDKQLMHFTYVRYLENVLRDTFGFAGTSIKFFVRERKV